MNKISFKVKIEKEAIDIHHMKVKVRRLYPNKKIKEKIIRLKLEITSYDILTCT
jgi:hypothetical protein